MGGCRSVVPNSRPSWRCYGRLADGVSVCLLAPLLLQVKKASRAGSRAGARRTSLTGVGATYDTVSAGTALFAHFASSAPGGTDSRALQQRLARELARTLLSGYYLKKVRVCANVLSVPIISTVALVTCNCVGWFCVLTVLWHLLWYHTVFAPPPLPDDDAGGCVCAVCHTAGVSVVGCSGGTGHSLGHRTQHRHAAGDGRCVVAPVCVCDCVCVCVFR